MRDVYIKGVYFPEFLYIYFIVPVKGRKSSL